MSLSLLALCLSAQAADLAVVHATILPVSGPPIEDGTLLVTGGKIEALGRALPVPPGTTTVVDATGRTLTPGLIDTHSHMGVYSWPGSNAHGDGNEAIDPFTPRVWAGDSVHVEDPAFAMARAGGVTTVQILPGSANLVGGQSAVLKNRPSRTLQGMLLVGAPRGIKMACGENPKRVYAGDIDGPQTRMGNLAAFREELMAAQDYREARKRKEPPPRDLDMEVLLDVLDGEIRVHLHCYRGDDIEGMLRVMDEFGVKITSIQHAVEAYKVRDLLAAHGTGIATWPDWWGFKMESYDAIPQNAMLVKRAGVPVNMHSDSATTVQRLHIEAAKLLAWGMTEQEALETITLDPARLLGLEDRVGSLSPGKDADFVLFSAHPFDMYSLVQQTWIDGQKVYDRAEQGAPDGWF